jgi:hypothetical protein
MGEKCPRSILCSRIEVLLGREAAESVAQYVSDTFKVSSNHQVLPALIVIQIHSRYVDWSTRASSDCDTLNIDDRLKLMTATNR